MSESEGEAPAFTANPGAPLVGAAASIDRTALLAIIWIFYSVASCFVALRLVVRFRQNGSFFFDDYWIIFAWCCLTTMATLETVKMDALWYLTFLTSGRVAPGPETTAWVEELTRWQFPVIKLFWTVLWAVKASFMAVFFRLVKPFPILRKLWYCVAVFATLAYLGCWIASTLTCTSPADYFKAGQCNSPMELWRQTFNILYSTSVDVATDLMIMALPIAVLPSLQLDLRRKIGLGIAFSLGLIIISVAIVRMTQVIIGAEVDLVGLTAWGAIETSVAVIVGCLPPLKALLSRSVKKYHSNKKSGYGTGGVQGGSNQAGYGPSSVSRTVMVAESIPLDDIHRSNQKDGRIFVQKTYETNVEYGRDSSSRDDDEVGIVRGQAR